jgi:sucrose-6-phosphate hydrolase SacC (GH32 family)
LYKAKDDSLLHWDYQGILFRYPDADVANIECPNIAQIGDKWVLLVSVRGHVESFVGDIDKSMQFHASSRGVLDPGSYASQLLHDKHGQAIHLAWVPTDDRKGWNGFLTLPSLLSLAKDGTLLRTPIPDLHELRGQRFDLKDTAVSQELDLSSKVSGDLLEVVAHVQFKDSKGFGIKLRRSADGSRAQTLHYEATHGDLELDVFLDRGVIDEYGSVNRTTRFSARQGDLGVSLFADGGSVIVKSLEIYKLRPAKFELVGW